MASEIVYYGAEIKLAVGLNPIDEYSMDDYDFECEFYCYSNRRVRFAKKEMKRKDKDIYVAVVDTKDVGSGSLKCRITANIPDADCEDGMRTEVLVLDTGIQIW